MKFFISLLTILLVSDVSFGQAQLQDVKYSPVQLREDLDYLKHLIINVHVNPNSELSPDKYNELFSHIASSLNDSADATDFLKKIKPIIAHLSDEHSQLSLKPALLSNAYQNEPVYLPLTLKQADGDDVIDACLDNQCDMIKGQAIVSINGIPLKELLAKCALATTGFPGQRMATALRQFGYLYPWASPKLTTTFLVKTKNGKMLSIPGTKLKVWGDYFAMQANAPDCEERLSYTRYGAAGYINACSFDVKPKGKYSLDSIKHKIDDIFGHIKKDGVNKLVIDISNNEGGNSAVGDYLISYIWQALHGLSDRLEKERRIFTTAEVMGF
jgi:hypothetical protein